MVAAFLGQSRREGMYTDKKTFPLNDRSPHYWDKILPGENVEEQNTFSVIETKPRKMYTDQNYFSRAKPNFSLGNLKRINSWRETRAITGLELVHTVLNFLDK